jgi:myo-inositol-hexaphosphate 3-phosphohydrolase
MKKIALAAFSATAVLALSACGGDAEAPVVEETPVEVMPVEPVEPVVDETPMADDTDVMVEDTTTTDEAFPAE